MIFNNWILSSWKILESFVSDFEGSETLQRKSRKWELQFPRLAIHLVNPKNLKMRRHDLESLEILDKLSAKPYFFTQQKCPKILYDLYCRIQKLFWFIRLYWTSWCHSCNLQYFSHSKPIPGALPPIHPQLITSWYHLCCPICRWIWIFTTVRKVVNKYWVCWVVNWES